MTDKERILFYILRQLSFNRIKYNDGVAGLAITDVFFRHPEYGKNEIKIGDIVLCQSSGIHDWTVGYVHEIKTDSYIVVKDLTSDRKCNIENDSFLVLEGVMNEHLLYGEQLKLKNKIIKAFRKEDEWLYRYGGIRFDNNLAYVTITERLAIKGREPFEIEIYFTKNTTIKSIIEQLRAGGYGSKWE